MARRPVEQPEVIDLDSTDNFLDAPDIRYEDGKTLVERLADQHLGEPSKKAPPLPVVDH